MTDKSIITCKKLNATIPKSTCVARQRAVSKQMADRLKSKNKGNGPAWGYLGGDGAVLKYISCIGCTDYLAGKYSKKDIQKKQEAEKEPKMEVKTCTKCGIKKSIDLFYKQSTSKDGHQYQCKKCINLAMALKNGTSKHLRKEEEIQAPLPPSVPTLFSEPEKTQVCRKCKKKMPLTAEFYHRCQIRATGFREICKTCRSESRPDKKSEVRVVLNFKNDPDLLERVISMAKKERREIGQQILCVLEKVVI
ncbi:MAG TPA: hypothetical protein VGD14_09430 [bacterium]